ncbi:hypothetical protein [Ralstonia sp. UBA689]|uniref:hypothetical protein n=1 Tax=Ralstonia sp. UBA689 TaxID=1947373 RepID=UPI0025EBC426|nr:hypothetical protein [Ralstonia sp. UBA689]
MHKPDPKIRATARPMRVAYVLENGEDAHAWLDEVIAQCYGRHGGRQSLIVPSMGGGISDGYAAWLKVLDPDVVMLLTYENATAAANVGALLGDTLLAHRQRRPGEIENRPALRLETPALTALSWIPFLKTVSGFRNQPINFILDRYPAWRDDGLIKDNFGTLCDSVGLFPVHEQIGVRPVMLTPPDPSGDRWHFRIANAVEVQDPYNMLENLLRSGTSTLAHLSNLNCQPFRPDHPWHDAFCLVIGDSFEDRIACWNAGLLFDDATTQSIKTLRLPAAIATDEERTAKVAAFLRGANWLGGNAGPPKIVVRSHSLREAVLEDFLNWLRQGSRSQVAFEAIGSLDDCCPADATAMHAAYRMLRPAPAMNEAAAAEPSTFVSIPSPHQLKYCAGQHPIFSEGKWYVDLMIDKVNDHGRFVNARQAWMLPQRRQLIKDFVRVDGTRILRRGNLSVPSHAEVSTLEVTQPDDSLLFRRLLTETETWAYGDIRFKQDVPPAFRYSDTSDKGRYLAGLLGMFGSLSDVEHTMDMRFWRRQFFSMAAPANDQRAEVITFLKRRLNAKSGTLLIDDAEGWERLAQRVVQSAARMKIPQLRVRYDKLLERWRKELNEAMDLDENLKQRADSILAEAPGELKSSLSFLIERGVFYRGHEWVCRNCSHRNWVGLRMLTDELPCEVCASGHQLPVDMALDFRLNEFFATCLREHDTLTVACILSALREEARSFFTFQPQTAIYAKYPEEQGGAPNHELDILCVSDGKFIIGEAKARAELIATSDITDLAQIAKSLQVDVAVLGTLLDERGVMPTKLAQLQALLPNTIKATSIVAAWDDRPSAYLCGKMHTFSM